jgi:hypothetical protein
MNDHVSLLRCPLRCPVFSAKAKDQPTSPLPQISVDDVWTRMGIKLEHMLTSFTEHSGKAPLSAAEWMRMYTYAGPFTPHEAFCLF